MEYFIYKIRIKTGTPRTSCRSDLLKDLGVSIFYQLNRNLSL